MSLDDHKRLTLETNLARDRAEHLLAEVRRAFAEAQADIAAGKRPDLSPEQVAMGEQAMRNAIASAERMVANLNSALSMAEAGFDEPQDAEDGDPPDGTGPA